MDGESPDYSTVDNEHRHWFVRSEMELFAIQSLAHGYDPRRRDEAIWNFRAHYNALKATRSKGLEWDLSQCRRGEFDLGASVRLTDLLVFLESAEPQYDWLRHFAARWRAFHPHLENERFSKPSYSDQEMQDWFRERVSNWGNNKPPSEASDWKEFRMRFPGVKREPFRELRRANTPPEWRKQGPR